MSEGKHTPSKLEVDSENMFLFGRCVGGVQMKDDSFMLAQIRGWGHLQYRDDGVATQKANIHRLADCWNSHDQLVEALKKIANKEDSSCESGKCGWPDDCYRCGGADFTGGNNICETAVAKEALKAAGEEV